MEKVIVKRMPEVVINGPQYLLDDEGAVKIFDSEDDAIRFLHEHGVTDKEISDCISMDIVCGVCPRCGGPLFKSDIGDYSYQCFACDEDFFECEVKEKVWGNEK